MRRCHTRLAAAGALAAGTMLLTAVFVGAAFAGNGNGNGGNSANAPGHQKQEQAAQPQQSAAPPQAQAQQQSQQQSSSQPGVKPSSTTKHDTDTKVGDNPDVSKRYGNGRTAAEIAKSRGAPDSQPLHGPGNSQPHKTYDCRHKNNPSGGVDVHAIKQYSATGCASVTVTKSVTKALVPAKTPEQPSEHKVTLCHATGSTTNPYVLITVDYHALKNGHTAAKGDIIPPTTINGVTYSANWDANGQAIFNNGCKPVVVPAKPAVAPAAAVAPTTTVTTTTPTTTTPTTTTVNEAPVITTTTVPVTTTVTVTTQSSTTTTVAGAAAPTTTTTGGGVLGAETSLAKPKPASHHGVLGTVTHVTGGTLPFTGFPVWLAVLVAAGLILGGIALRRRTAGARL